MQEEQTVAEILASLQPPAPAPEVPRPLLERLREAIENDGYPGCYSSGGMFKEAADFVEASMRREFAEHVIATDAARDARAHPLRAIFTEADPISVKWDATAGFEAVAEMSAAQIEARAAGLKSGMTLRAAVKHCVRTGDALRPADYPRGFHYILTPPVGHLPHGGNITPAQSRLCTPGHGGVFPAVLTVEMLLGPWVTLPMAQANQEVADRMADGEEVR